LKKKVFLGPAFTLGSQTTSQEGTNETNNKKKARGGISMVRTPTQGGKKIGKRRFAKT